MPTTRELFHLIDTSAFPVNNLLTDQLFCVDAVAELSITSKLQRGKLNNGETLDCAYGLVVGKYKGLPTVDYGWADAGYRSDMMRFPEQHFSVAVLCNYAETSPSSLARAVADIYLAARREN